MPLIEAKDLTIGYDASPVASGISFTVNEGDYLCIVGENGAGKSTLIKTILGLLPPISGSFSYGDDLRKNEIGYLPQQTQVQRDFPASVREVVFSGLEGKRGLRLKYSALEKERANSSMRELDIERLSSRCYRELSGGQQQRVLLARSLCATEKVLLLDEPVAGLDPSATTDMYEAIKRLNDSGIAVIMISHDISAALTYASHILHVGRHTFFGDRKKWESSDIGKSFVIRESASPDESGRREEVIR